MTGYFDEIDFTINSQNINKLQENISSEASVVLSVGFQKENFRLHATDDFFDEKKKDFISKYGDHGAKNEKQRIMEKNKEMVDQLLDKRKGIKLCCGK